ncbi:B3 domain-containing protein REM9-like [Capsicum galapagoense]
MLVDPDKHPSFCKLLFKLGFMNKILMPPVFIKENKKMLAKTCLLKTNAVGLIWEAKIVRENSNYFICDGDWPQFVVHHKLELGDILIFFLIDKSTFQVLPYNQKSCKSFSGKGVFQELSSSSAEEHDVGIARKLKKIKMEPKESSEEEKAKGGNGKKGPKKNRFSVVNLNSKDPYFEMVVRKTHSIFMTIPLSFAKGTGTTNMKKMRLVNEKGNEWKLVDIVHTRYRVLIKGGWAEFRTRNKIANGQTCRFKLIKGNGCGNNVLQLGLVGILNLSAICLRCKSSAKADDMVGVKKKAPEIKETCNCFLLYARMTDDFQGS